MSIKTYGVNRKCLHCLAMCLNIFRQLCLVTGKKPVKILMLEFAQIQRIEEASTNKTDQLFAAKTLLL